MARGVARGLTQRNFILGSRIGTSLSSSLPAVAHVMVGLRDGSYGDGTKYKGRDYASEIV